jgi:hypothetical protein
MKGLANSEKGRVLQYDKGKWKDGDAFKIRSHLNRPPRILLDAMQLLQSDHDFEEGKLKEYVDSVRERSLRQKALKSYVFLG